MLSVLARSSFNEVFPQLPVIAITFAFEAILILVEILVKDFKLSLTNNCFDLLANRSILFTTANEAPFLNDSLTKRFPSFFFPLIAKKISFFFISFELIDAFRNFNFREK